MGKYTERITGHRVNALVDNLLEATKKARELHFADEASQEGLVRISAGVEYISSAISGLNPYLCRPSDLDILSNHIDIMISNLGLFVSEKNSSYANTTNDALDNSLEIIARLLPKQPKIIYRGLLKVFEDTNTRIKTHQKFVSDQQKQITETKETLETEFEELKSTIEKALTELRNTHNSALKAMQDELISSRETFETEFAALTKELNENITNTADEHNTNFDTQIQQGACKSDIFFT